MHSSSRTTDLRAGFALLPRYALVAACLFASLAACEREDRDYRGERTPKTAADTATVSTLQPGEQAPAPADPRLREYEGNAYHINQGERLYRWFNCNGCHGAGGGNIGPALMDDEWRYGGNIDQIVATILQGRPNGMPSFRGKIPEAQVWEIAAYVRALSGNVPKDAAPSRSDSLSNTPPLTQLPKQPPKTEPEPP